jgi:anti-anti-sigma factor
VSDRFTLEHRSGEQARVSGRIDVENVAQALAAGEPLAAQSGRLEINLKDLRSADSVTLAVLLAWSARARRNGGELVYRDVSPQLRSIAHLSDAENLLGIESRDTARSVRLLAV